MPDTPVCTCLVRLTARTLARTGFGHRRAHLGTMPLLRAQRCRCPEIALHTQLRANTTFKVDPKAAAAVAAALDAMGCYEGWSPFACHLQVLKLFCSWVHAVASPQCLSREAEPLCFPPSSAAALALLPRLTHVVEAGEAAVNVPGHVSLHLFQKEERGLTEVFEPPGQSHPASHSASNLASLKKDGVQYIL
eukprot:524242-Pelagomonas_calceolata.AAC.3